MPSNRGATTLESGAQRRQPTKANPTTLSICTTSLSAAYLAIGLGGRTPVMLAAGFAFGSESYLQRFLEDLARLGR